MRVTSSVLGAAAALVLCVAFSVDARADVEGEVRSKDKVLGTILPGSEVESWRIACPVGSKLKVALKGPKKKSGGAVTFRVLDPSDDVINGLQVVPKGTGAKLAGYVVPDSGLYTVQVVARDGVTGGDYTLKIVCTPPKKLRFDATLDGSEQTYTFFSVLGTTLKTQLKPARGSAAGPRLVRIDGPDGYSETFDPGKKGIASPKVQLPGTGEFELFFSGDGGDVAGLVKLKPKKSATRTIDVRSSTIDPDSDGAAQAVVGIVGPEGGGVVVGGDGTHPADIGGSGIDVPPGAIDGPVALVIATAAPIGPQAETEDRAGNTAFYGPEGLEFSADATLTLPFDPSIVESEGDVRVYTRDAGGNVVLIDPSTYVVNLDAGTVTVPTAHFSSFRVFGERGPLSVENVVTEIADTPGDVIVYRGVDGGVDELIAGDAKAGTFVGFGAEYLLAHGEVIDRVVVDPFGAPTLVERVAGGGPTAQPGGTALDFDFPGPVTALATDGFAVYASTATQIFALRPDGQGAFDVELIAGTGVAGDSGDGGDPVAATFSQIVDLLFLPTASGELLVLDRAATRLRAIQLFDATPTIATLLGTGSSGVGPDGAPRTTSPLLDPTAMAVGLEPGEVFVADGGRVRLVQVLDGFAALNRTFAGPVTGVSGPGADGVARFDAGFEEIAGMVLDATRRRLIVTDRGTHTVQEIPVAPGGIVRSLVGTRGEDTAVPAGFETPGTLSSPGACLLDFTGNLVFSEIGTSSLRCVTIGGGPVFAD